MGFLIVQERYHEQTATFSGRPHGPSSIGTWKFGTKISHAREDAAMNFRNGS
jgi:hypothetical protein